MRITSREEARSQGCKTFFTGIACPYGHRASRFVINNRCSECARVYRKRRKEALSSEEKDEKRRVAREKDATPERRARRKELFLARGGYTQEQRDRYKARYLDNKDYVRERTYAWRKNNPEKAQQSVQKWREKNKAHVLAYAKGYAAKKREGGPKKNTGAPARAFRLEREQINVISRNSRARSLGAKGVHTAEDVRALLLHQEKLCRYCRKNISHDFHVDHEIPLVRGGSNTKENLQLLCPSCNLSKQDKTTDEYLSFLIEVANSLG